MKPESASKLILKKLLDQFEIKEGMPNQEYLESQLDRLNKMSGVYNAQSTNEKSSPATRARARDLEQNCIGLINGIKFGISFWLHENEDLTKLHEEQIKKDIKAIQEPN